MLIEPAVFVTCACDRNVCCGRDSYGLGCKCGYSRVRGVVSTDLRCLNLQQIPLKDYEPERMAVVCVSCALCL